MKTALTSSKTRQEIGRYIYHEIQQRALAIAGLLRKEHNVATCYWRTAWSFVFLFGLHDGTNVNLLGNQRAPGGSVTPLWTLAKTTTVKTIMRILQVAVLSTLMSVSLTTMTMRKITIPQTKHYLFLYRLGAL